MFTISLIGNRLETYVGISVPQLIYKNVIDEKLVLSVLTAAAASDTSPITFTYRYNHYNRFVIMYHIPLTYG